MVSLNEVESNLKDDEKILWKKQANTNELKELRFTLNILILTIGASLFTILLYFLTSTIEFEFLITLFILLTVLLISAIPLYFYFRIYNEYKKIAVKLGLELSSLRNYEEFYILTNKRWIQKSFYLAKIDDSKYSIDQIIKQNDLAYVDLDNINVIYISLQKKHAIYWVSFFNVWDKDVEESILQVFLEEIVYQHLMETIREVFQITKEEQDIISYGDSALYCKKKK